MTGARRGTSHNLIYKETGWPKLSERRTATKLKNLIKIANNDTPHYLHNLLPPKIGDNYRLIKTRTETFRKSFIPSTVKLWNDLPLHERSHEHSVSMSKSHPNILFYEGPRDANVKHAQMRMQCSKLNGHLFQLHVTDSPECPCGYCIEDSKHFLLNCPLYNIPRQRMMLNFPVNFDITKIDAPM